MPISVKENSKRTSGNSLGPNLHFKDTSDEFVCWCWASRVNKEPGYGDEKTLIMQSSIIIGNSQH